MSSYQLSDHPCRDRLIYALDVSSLEEVRASVGCLHDLIGYFKVGMQICTAQGAPRVVQTVHSAGGNTFLDLKYHDIPETVGLAVKEAAQLGVSMMTVHALGGAKMLEYAVKNRGNSEILAVTLLTSIGEETAKEDYLRTSSEIVRHLAERAVSAGCNGIICSPKDLAMLRDLNIRKITPGIRPADTAVQNDDQKRADTPQAALRGGASRIVVGRPIRDSPDGPRNAALRILQGIQEGLSV